MSYLGFTISGGLGMTPRYMAAYIGDRDLQPDADGNTIQHNRGFLTFRWLDTPEVGEPQVRKVKFEAIQ